MLGAQELAFMRRTVFYAHAKPTPRRVIESEVAAPYDTSRFRDRYKGSASDRREAEMRRESTRVTVSQTRSRPKSSMPLPPWAFDDTKVIRAIATLPEDYQHWLRYAYADSREWCDEQGASVALWRRFEPTIGSVQDKTRKTCKGLAHLAVQCHKSRKNSGKVAHPPARIQQLLGVTRASWDKRWCPRWSAMHDIMNQLDREALEALWRITG